jgi:hypothetical protein
MGDVHTTFGSLKHYEKGGVQVIDDSPKRYAFSNVFEVASKSKPYEKVAVAQNLKYVVEAIRAEGVSPWYSAAHDESALIMDGEIEIHLIQPDQPLVPDSTEGTVGTEDGLGEGAPRPHGVVAERLSVSVPEFSAGRRPAANDQGRDHRRAVGGYLPGQLKSAGKQRNS